MGRALDRLHLGGQEFTNILKAVDNDGRGLEVSSVLLLGIQALSSNRRDKGGSEDVGLDLCKIEERKFWKLGGAPKSSLFVPESLGCAFAVFDGGSRREKRVMRSWLEVV